MEQTNNELKPEHLSYDPVYFDRLAAVENKHFWFRSRNQVIRKLIQQTVVKFQPGYRVLEIGCGTGNVLNEMRKACPQGLVVGADLFFEGLKFARDRVTCPLIQADLHDMPFQAKFNLIGLFDVIEHITDDEEVLEQLKQILVPGGYLFITVPANPSLWSYTDKAAYHIRRYKLVEMENKLLSAGFRIEFITHYMTFIFPIVWFSRKLNALSSRNKPMSKEQATDLTMAEFKITPLINLVFTWLLSLEARILKLRIKLPVGTSLLALVQKPLNNAIGGKK